MAISTMDGLVAALASAQSASFNKTSVTVATGDLPVSLWSVGGFPNVGVAPAGPGAGGSTLSSASTGAIPFTNPGGGNSTYLARVSAASRRPAQLVLYDRLWHCGPIAFNGVTAVTTPPDMPRYGATYAGLEIWVEWTTIAAAAGCSFVARYGDSSINQPTAGNKSTLAVTNATGYGNPGEMMQLPLPQPDGGVQFVDQLTVSGGNAGAGNLVVMKRLATWTLGGDSNCGGEFDFTKLGLPQIADNACLALMLISPNATVEWCMGELRLAQG